MFPGELITASSKRIVGAALFARRCGWTCLYNLSHRDSHCLNLVSVTSLARFDLPQNLEDEHIRFHKNTRRLAHP
jgi:hypothetical protein